MRELRRSVIAGSFLIPLVADDLLPDQRVEELVGYQRMPLRKRHFHEDVSSHDLSAPSGLPTAAKVIDMANKRTRYPGAQPFSDESISRAVFFGREKESITLTDQIMAHRLVVVYAKSGLGKTSLLQAGVAQALREESFLPLFVRVNDVKRGPFAGVLGRIRDSAMRQNVEYISGSELSLWHFFKTAEFWNADRLLTPVLLLDQFEEIFTLHSPAARAAFLRQLGYLVRGVRPEFVQVSPRDVPLTDTPPAMRIVISLREDYLGWLEEAADNIPQILDHRFRLSRLTVDAAAAAMERPAQVQDDRLSTRLSPTRRTRCGQCLRNFNIAAEVRLSRLSITSSRSTYS